MRVLGLPGRLEATFPRMQAIVAALSPDAVVHRYAAWPDDPVPDEEAEAARVGPFRPDLVVAVSLGTLVAMAARARHSLEAKAYVFLGVPLDRLKAEGRVAILGEQALAAPTLFIQQTNDFTGPFADLAATLPAGVDLREVAGGDHVYDRTEELAALIRAWMSRRMC